MSSIANSPLRYPGGKAALSCFLSEVLKENGLLDGVYAEPYAGGAGAALNLLFAENVERIILNDADPCIFSFWDSILKSKDDFIDLLDKTPISVEEWKKQREIYKKSSYYPQILVAFASFYLNRCNRSGIIANGGPIGGIDQEGKWKIDARFNKIELIRRIEKIHLYRDRIKVYGLDAIDFIKKISTIKNGSEKILVYLDPPYYVKGSGLYLNHYNYSDHAHLAKFMTRKRSFRWLMTYDNVPEIRSLYADRKQIEFSLSYTAHSRKIGSELLIYSDNLTLPMDLDTLGLAANF